MLTKRTSCILLGATGILLLCACTSSLHEAPVGPAQAVTDWIGLEKLTRAGRIFFGGQPTSEALRIAQKRGITVVVNLRSDRETQALGFDEEALVRTLGIEYVTIPITPKTFGTDHADRLKAVLGRTRGPILIHCGSSNRVGAVWALYLNRHRGIALEDAVELGRRAGLRSDVFVEIIHNSVN